MAEFTELLKALPALIWTVVAVVILWQMRPELRSLFGRLDSFEGFGLKMSLKALAAAVEEKKVIAPESAGDVATVKARLAKEAQRLAGAVILWVDDRPSGNRNEADMLSALGARFIFAASTAEANDLLASRPERFDLILSDWSRPEGKDAGPDFLRDLRQRGVRTPMIFYVGTKRDLPVGAQGLTTRPGELAALVLDSLKFRG